MSLTIFSWHHQISLSGDDLGSIVRGVLEMTILLKCEIVTICVAYYLNFKTTLLCVDRALSYTAQNSDADRSASNKSGATFQPLSCLYGDRNKCVMKALLQLSSAVISSTIIK